MKRAMKRTMLLLVLAAALCASAVCMTACGSKDSKDYEHIREVSWEGTELTIKLGENQSTGCTWTTDPEDDSVIDYSTNRVFHLAASTGDAVGTLEAGFEGKGAGTTRIICTTPVGWDGTGSGLVYIVTVTVNEDGTIESAEGAEAEEVPEKEADDPESGETTDAEEATLEDYFAEHPDELKKMQDDINSNNENADFASVDLKVEGNTISYIFKFVQTYSAEEVASFKPDLEEAMAGDEMQSQMKELIHNAEEGYGIKGVTVYVEYVNGDGTSIASTTIK